MDRDHLRLVTQRAFSELGSSGVLPDASHSLDGLASFEFKRPHRTREMLKP